MNRSGQFSFLKPMSCGETQTNRYACQDILEDQLDFPTHFYPGDTVHGEYTDRMLQHQGYEEHRELQRRHFGRGSDLWSGLDPQRVKAFMEEYLGEPIDGFRMRRLTNVASGFPLWFIETYRKGPDSPEQETFSGQTGPLLRNAQE